MYRERAHPSESRSRLACTLPVLLSASRRCVTKSRMLYECLLSCLFILLISSLCNFDISNWELELARVGGFTIESEDVRLNTIEVLPEIYNQPGRGTVYGLIDPWIPRRNRERPMPPGCFVLAHIEGDGTSRNQIIFVLTFVHETRWIRRIRRIVLDVAEEICISRSETCWIECRPPSRDGIIVSLPVDYQARFAID